MFYIPLANFPGLQFSACQNENCRKPLLNGLNLGNIHMELKNKEVREDDANKTPSQPPIPYPRKVCSTH